MANEVVRFDRPVDKSTGRVDVAKALKLRLKNGMTINEIADHFGVTKQAISQALKSFRGLLNSDASSVEAFDSCKPQLLSAVEQKMLQALLDPDKLQKASLNNVAYAFTQIHSANRLERNLSTDNVSVFSRVIEAACEGEESEKLAQLPQDVVVESDSGK